MWFIQVMDIVDRLFVGMFDSLNQRCQKELEAIGRQYPFKPLKVIFLPSSFPPILGDSRFLMLIYTVDTVLIS